MCRPLPEAVGKLFPNFEFNLHVVAIELMLTLWKSEPNCYYTLVQILLLIL